jgi:hypothetical protein
MPFFFATKPERMARNRDKAQQAHSRLDATTQEVLELVGNFDEMRKKVLQSLIEAYERYQRHSFDVTAQQLAKPIEQVDLSQEALINPPTDAGPAPGAPPTRRPSDGGMSMSNGAVPPVAAATGGAASPPAAAPSAPKPPNPFAAAAAAPPPPPASSGGGQPPPPNPFATSLPSSPGPPPKVSEVSCVHEFAGECFFVCQEREREREREIKKYCSTYS